MNNTLATYKRSHSPVRVVGVYSKIKRYDPTNTGIIRNAFVRQLNKRFANLKRLIKQAIVDQDVFGLTPSPLTMAVTGGRTTGGLPGSKAFQFNTTPEKVTAFMEWLKEQTDAGILEVRNIQQIGASTNAAWTDQYIGDSYKRGVIRSRYEMGNAGMGTPSLDSTGGIMASMSTPFHMDRVGLLYSRAYEELKGITTTMGSQISRVLSQGMADGDNPKLLAKKLLATIEGTGGDLGITDTLGRYISAERRAAMMARTEVIRAHHQGMVQEYKNWAVEGVIVKAEWVTAGFDVCPECATLEGQVFTLKEIENMIPRHPNCRCIALPTMPDANAPDKKETIVDTEKETIDNLIQETKERNERIGIDDSNIYIDFEARSIGSSRSTEELRRVMGNPISTEILMGRKSAAIPREVHDYMYVDIGGVSNLNVLFEKAPEILLNKDVLNVSQKYVFEKAINKSGEKAIYVINYKNKNYVIDGNNTLAKKIIRGEISFGAKVLYL